MIPFNKPYLSGNESSLIQEVLGTQNLSSGGIYTNKCEKYFEQKFNFKKAILTNSCTAALEIAALIIDIKPGDEVIIPSYTYVSTAIVFEKLGARIVFADCHPDFPNLDEQKLERLINSKTKAIVPMHYAGSSCNMQTISEIATKHNIFIIEDAAMAINSKYNTLGSFEKFVGSFGHFAAFSFHETKNITSGEGGMLVINDERFFERAEIIRDKGTNKKSFFKGAVNKYEWVDLGGSFSPNEITAAYLFAQLNQLDFIQEKRSVLWNYYLKKFREMDCSFFYLPQIPNDSTPNFHAFFILCETQNFRDKLIDFMKNKGVQLAFHYNSLHKSQYYLKNHERIDLPNSDFFSSCLVRLPLYVELTLEDIDYITDQIMVFVSKFEA